MAVSLSGSTKIKGQSWRTASTTFWKPAPPMRGKPHCWRPCRSRSHLAQRRTPRLWPHPRRDRPDVDHQPGSSGDPAGHAQVGPDGVAEPGAALRRLQRRAAGSARPHLRVARPDLRPGGAAEAIIGASPARCSPPACGAAMCCTTASPITSPRRARCSKAAPMRSAAPSSPPAPAIPSCRCRRSRPSRPAAYAGTPDYLKIILEKADETGADLSSLRLGPCHRRRLHAGRASASIRIAGLRSSRATARPISAWSPMRAPPAKA